MRSNTHSREVGHVLRQLNAGLATGCLLVASLLDYTNGHTATPVTLRFELFEVVLGIGGTGFTLNSKRTFLLGASYFGSLGAPDNLTAALPVRADGPTR